MVSRNEHTGDFIKSKTSILNDNYEQIDWSVKSHDQLFETKECQNCHIKVTTSNNKCPLCEGELK